MLNVLQRTIIRLNNKLFLFFQANRLAKKGFVIIDGFNDDLIELGEKVCSELNCLVSKSKYDLLVPKRRADAHTFSLSGKYGLLEFPLHTDGSEYKVPPKYIILRSLINTPTATYIADSKFIMKKLLSQDSTWKVKTKDGVIKTKLIESHIRSNNYRIRFNRLSMKCESGDKIKVFEIINSLPVNQLNWVKNRTIIIDNWRMLHGRGRVLEDDYNSREIERVQIFV